MFKPGDRVKIKTHLFSLQGAKGTISAIEEEREDGRQVWYYMVALEKEYWNLTSWNLTSPFPFKAEEIKLITPREIKWRM